MFNIADLAPVLKYLTPENHFIIAFSGGLDSAILLHALATICDKKQRAQLRAVHINHSLSPNAAAWAQHCQQFCQKLQIDCKVVNVIIDTKSGEGLEAAARAARYTALAEQMLPGDYLLTAHQQDDQAETLLLQLLRGAGIKGLAAMPEITQFTDGYHLRPLLSFTRAELEEYAKKQNLQWIEDESNLDLRFDRNYLRQQVMPIIKQRWPAANKTLARTAKHCADAQSLLDKLADQELKQALQEPKSLSISYLRSLTSFECVNALRRWLHQMDLPSPSEVQLERIIQDLLLSRSDSCPRIILAGIELRRYRDQLYLLPLQNELAADTVLWNDLHKPLIVPEIGTLIATSVIAQGIRASAFPANKAVIKFRHFGERCHPVGRQGSHPLKKLFQEWSVPPWERGKIPLLYVADKLVAVIGYCVCETFAAQKNEPGLIISLQA